VKFFLRIALNIAGVYCFYLLNEIIWYPNFFIGIGFVVVGIFCFIKANDGTFSADSNDTIPNSHSSEINDDEINPLSDEELKLFVRSYYKRWFFIIFLCVVIGLVFSLSYNNYIAKEQEKEKKDNQRKKEIEQEYDLRAIEFSKPEVRNEMLGNLKIGDKIILQMKSLELFSGSSIISIDSNIIELKGGLFRNNEVQKVSIENIRWLKLRVRNKE
jgi:hypothetical protein